MAGSILVVIGEYTSPPRPLNPLSPRYRALKGFVELTLSCDDAPAPDVHVLSFLLVIRFETDIFAFKKDTQSLWDPTI